MAGERSGAALLLLVAATACTADEAQVVTIFGPEIGREQELFEAELAEFSAASGIRIEVEGTRNFENEISSRLAADDPPDIAMFPQPGRLRELSDQVPPLDPDVADLVRQNFDDVVIDQVRPAGRIAAVPVKIDLKSVVWYSPNVFRQFGYTVPTTFDEFLALADRMQADSHPPFCVGLESAEASGWPATDWIEDFLLRIAGTRTYDAWVDHEIAFDDQAVLDVATTLFERWSQDDYILGGPDAALATSFTDGGWPVVDGDCMMHRQSNFYSLFWPDGTEIGDGEGDVNAFKLPGDATLIGGLFAVPFSSDEDVVKVLEFLASARFGRAMAGHEEGGFLSPNKNVETTDYSNPLSLMFASILATALRETPDTVRFDASDQMPGAVGTGTFWTAMVDVVSTTEDVPTAFGEVEENWPPP